jgi:putative FmdB family regulatory protein
MPVYAYRCANCDVQFEQAQKFSDAPLEVCPHCGKKALRKVFLPVSIVFKGSGFYATDHRSPSGAPRATGAGESKSGSESSSSSESSSGESKPSGNGKSGDKPAEKSADTASSSSTSSKSSSESSSSKSD